MSDLLNAKDVKKLLRVSLPMVYKLADQGRLSSIRIPSLGRGQRQKTIVRFKMDDVLEFIEKYYQKS